ncbi:lantibiotic dehydratase C-terminal domain-containing protein [Streptomyces sp. NPDC015125]|uniref:lantibiotic dehydratase C-terminal domain-containing protein n=1 Tax=Streptomyces sp. NPDC015125 TaxID=3364938 RepID=UPI0036F66FD1
MTSYPVLPPAEGVPAADDRWLAVYIFYAGSPRPLLTTCIKPLFAELTSAGLIRQYFFLNYWLEGPHIRVRFQLADPSDAVMRDAVKARVEDAVSAFLRRRPSLYEVKSDFYVGLYNTLFDLEYTDAQRQAHLGEDGRMRLRANNSFHWTAYEPEYDKYGGPVGTELAEWHFTRSTDLVIDAMAVMNLHMRSVLFGHAGQLMMVMCSAFLDENPAVVRFLERYRDYWHSAFRDTDLVSGSDFDRNYDPMATAVAERFGAISKAVREGAGHRLPGSLGAWAEHCLELRRRVTELARSGQLVFPSWERTHRITVTDPGEAVARLLSAYLHMTNNRLHITLTDEAYLAHVLVRALTEPSDEAEGAA